MQTATKPKLRTKISFHFVYLYEKFFFAVQKVHKSAHFFPRFSYNFCLFVRNFFMFAGIKIAELKICIKMRAYWKYKDVVVSDVTYLA